MKSSNNKVYTQSSEQFSSNNLISNLYDRYRDFPTQNRHIRQVSSWRFIITLQWRKSTRGKQFRIFPLLLQCNDIVETKISVIIEYRLSRVSQHLPKWRSKIFHYLYIPLGKYKGSMIFIFVFLKINNFTCSFVFLLYFLSLL